MAQNSDMTALSLPSLFASSIREFASEEVSDSRCRDWTGDGGGVGKSDRRWFAFGCVVGVATA